MNNQTENEMNTQNILNRFWHYGLFGGLAIGLLIGVLISGPNFHIWQAKTSILVILGCAAVGGFIGYFASSLAGLLWPF